MTPKTRYLLARLLLPFSRRELPGWGRLAEMLAATPSNDNQGWQGLPVQFVRGKWHGYVMPLDLTNWSQRLTWYMGRFYEADTQLVIRALVKPGDSFIDVGANIGMISLLASRQVGSAGRVFSFEPNPVACEALRKVIQLNGITNIAVYEVALSNRAARNTLSATNGHDGVGTLADVTGNSDFDVTYSVATATGDSVLSDSLGGNVFIKIDVEGFELFALEGLRQTIKKYRPTMLTEFEPGHLERAGSSARELLRFALNGGYRLYNIEAKRERLRYQVYLRDAGDGKNMSRNVLWAPEKRHEDPNILGLL